MPHYSHFVSDLHLFARRSQAVEHITAIDRAAAESHTFVLGGDIFDFRWSTLQSLEHSVEAAVQWLDELTARHGHCEFHFVLGNHDYHLAFIDRLAQLSRESDNLHWHRYYVRLGSSLFLHGDVADRKTTPEQLARRRARKAQHDHSKGEMAHLLYDFAIEARLHKAVGTLFNRPQRVARRIVRYLEHIGHGPENGLRDVYFGHTHAALCDYEYGGLRFHNGGAPMKGLEFQVLKTRPLNRDESPPAKTA